MTDRKSMPMKADSNMINAAYHLLETMKQGSPERHKRIVAAVWEEMAKVAPRGKTTGLTPLQSRVHEIIADHIKDYGKPPRYADIGAQIGTNKGNVWYIIDALQKRGVLKKTHGSRYSIRLLIQPGESVTR